MRFTDFVATQLERKATRPTVLAAFGVLAMLTLRGQSPLGWDESVFAARAKDLAATNFDWNQITGAYWSDLRAPGFPGFMAVAFEIFGSSDFIARAVVVAFSIGLLVVIGRTLDLVAPAVVGTTAIILIATCPGFFATSTLAFADHPGAFFAFAAVYFTLRAHVSASPTGLVMVPLCLGIATAARYGAVLLVLVPFVVIAGMVATDTVRARSWRNLVPFAAAGAVTLALLATLLSTTVLTRTMSPRAAASTAVERIGNEATNWLQDLRTILEPGAVDYGFNGAFWGWSYFLAFVILVLVALTRLLMTRRFMWIALFAAISAGPLVLYGVTVRQFVTTYLAPGFASGAACLAWALFLPERDATNESEASARTDTERQPARLVQFGAITAAIAMLFVGWRTFTGVEAMHYRLTGFEQVRVAATAADDVLGADCRLFTTRVPQAAWYSDCHVTSFSGTFQPDGEAVGGGLPWDAYLKAQAARVDTTSDPSLGFILLEGAGGQPAIDDVWDARIADQSVIFRSDAGRRVALVGVEVD